MEPVNIAEICQKLKLSGCYHRELAVLFENRSLSLLPYCKRLPDISNIMYALSRKTPSFITRQFEAALDSNLDEIDVIVLSNLAEIFSSSNISTDLSKKIQAHVIHHIDTVVGHISRFHKISKFFFRRNFDDPEHEFIF